MRHGIVGAALACVLSLGAGAEERHGFAILGTLKYGPDFKHFDYVDPQAPKGGTVRLWFQGTFDSLNPFILKGVPAAGHNPFAPSGGFLLPFENLMVASADEPDSYYGLVARSVELPPSREWVAFRLRPEARFHDGSRITAEDVVFSFETLKTNKFANPNYRVLYEDIVEARALAPDHVRFTFKAGAVTRDLASHVAVMPILSKAYYVQHDFAKASLEVPLSSGPYEVELVDPGRSITYRRVKDHWAKDLPAYRGRYNFDRLQWIYFRERTIGLQALFAGKLDFREEFTSRDWATRYDVPAVKDGRIIRELVADETPSGSQAFFLNTRREKFKDRRVRKALGLVFDFEWTNETIFHDAYLRTRSIFENSELAARAAPTPAELELLKPARGKLPDAAFEKPFLPPVNGGVRALRPNLRAARRLLEEAGWRIVDKLLVDREGNHFRIEFLSFLQGFERIVLPYTENLRRLGIEATFRLVEPSQYQRRLITFDYDVVTSRFVSSLTPGVGLRNFWSSTSARAEGSRNLAGVADPVIDSLVENVIAARNRDELRVATRALDRMVMWNHYLVPQWYLASHRIAYWDVFGRPESKPKYALGFLDTWWIDPAKRARIEASR